MDHTDRGAAYVAGIVTLLAQSPSVRTKPHTFLRSRLCREHALLDCQPAILSCILAMGCHTGRLFVSNWQGMLGTRTPEYCTSLTEMEILVTVSK